MLVMAPEEEEAEVGEEVVEERAEAQMLQQQPHLYLLPTQRCSSKVPLKWELRSGSQTMLCRIMDITIPHIRTRRNSLLVGTVWSRQTCTLAVL